MRTLGLEMSLFYRFSSFYDSATPGIAANVRFSMHVVLQVEVLRGAPVHTPLGMELS